MPSKACSGSSTWARTWDLRINSMAITPTQNTDATALTPPTPCRTQPVKPKDLLPDKPWHLSPARTPHQAAPYTHNSPAQDASQAPRVKSPCLMTSTHLNQSRHIPTALRTQANQ